MFSTLLNKIDILEPLIEKTGKSQLMNKAKFLYDRILNPDSYIVFLGETSCGKSSLINGLVGSQLLPVKAFPSTAAIAEIVFKYNLQADEYFVISKDAKMRQISKQDFILQCETPILNTERLRAQVGTDNLFLNNLRLFDTPGYGAIIDEHEEILKDFIPNSDIVIYVVSYRVGIQDYDYSFLGFLRELLRDDANIVLVINRCPVGIDVHNDSRIKEIKSYASDLLTIDPQVFCVDNVVADDATGHAIPKCESLWQYIGTQINSEKRKKLFYDVFDGYIRDLYEECDNVVQLRYKEALLSENECYKIRMAQREFADNIRKSIKQLVEPTFSQIKSKLPQKIDEVERRVNYLVSQKISDADKLSKDEMVAFTNSHLLPFTIKKEMGEVIQYIDVELSDLNKKLDDYIQKEIVRFNKNVEVILDTNIDNAAKTIAQEYVKRTMGSALSEYFMGYAGAAGVKGGVANAASHYLKVVGDWFGKTFSKQTHVMMQRIGATAAKGLGVAIVVVTELLFEAIDMATWKPKLIKKVKVGVEKWKQDMLPMVLKDMDELMDTNTDTLYSIAKQMDDGIEEVSATDVEECKRNKMLSESIKIQLKY